MKRLFRLTLAAALMLVASNAMAQKYGYLNSRELLSLMPERDSVTLKLQKLQEDYESQLEAIQVEFNNRYEEYQKNLSTYSDAMRGLKERELNELQTRYQEFSNLAAQELDKTQAELLAPVIERANDAIKKISKAQGFLIVFDLASGPVVYFDESQLTNMLPLVAPELGITLPATSGTN